jgi:hypothetical protein
MVDGDESGFGFMGVVVASVRRSLWRRRNCFSALLLDQASYPLVYRNKKLIKITDQVGIFFGQQR